MTPYTIGLIGIGILFILLFSRMHIGLVMAVVGFAGLAYLTGFEPALTNLRTVPFRTFADYGLSVIPLFILMGSFCFFAGLSKDLYDTVHIVTFFCLFLGHFHHICENFGSIPVSLPNTLLYKYIVL